jgi:hypothetical protein
LCLGATSLGCWPGAAGATSPVTPTRSHGERAQVALGRSQVRAGSPVRSGPDLRPHPVQRSGHESPMPMSPKRKRVLIRESRDLVFRVCSGAGAFVGLLWSLHHWNTRPPECQFTTAAFSRCMDHTLVGSVVAFLVPVVIGMIAGAIVGALLASTIRSRGRDSRARHLRRPGWSPGRQGGHWLAARYRERCAAAGRRSRRAAGSATRRRATWASAAARKGRHSAASRFQRTGTSVSHGKGVPPGEASPHDRAIASVPARPPR